MSCAVTSSDWTLPAFEYARSVQDWKGAAGQGKAAILLQSCHCFGQDHAVQRSQAAATAAAQKLYLVNCSADLQDPRAIAAAAQLSHCEASASTAVQAQVATQVIGKPSLPSGGGLLLHRSLKSADADTCQSIATTPGQPVQLWLANHLQPI